MCIRDTLHFRFLPEYRLHLGSHDAIMEFHTQRVHTEVLHHPTLCASYIITIQKTRQLVKQLLLNDYFFIHGSDWVIFNPLI